MTSISILGQLQTQGPFQGTAAKRSSRIRAHYVKYFTHLASMTARWQFPELVQTSNGMHTNFQTITLSYMPEKCLTITLRVCSSW